MERLPNTEFRRVAAAYCPHCGHDSSMIRQTKRRGGCTARIHQCCHCGRRFRSTERGR